MFYCKWVRLARLELSVLEPEGDDKVSVRICGCCRQYLS